MFDKLRRVVTGHNAEGRSYFLIDGKMGDTASGSNRLGEIWNSAGGRIASRETSDRAANATELNPPPQGSRFRYFALPPEDTTMSREERDVLVAQRFEAMGASEALVDTTRHPAMHTTKTLDYIVLLSGEVTLLLDDGECHLKPFDVVVQQGTNHAWVNTGTETALLVAVLIDKVVE